MEELKELDLIEQKELREKCIERIDILDKVGKLIMLPNQVVASVEQTANYFEVDKEVIKYHIKKNKEELINNGLNILQGEKLKEFKTQVGELPSLKRQNKFTVFPKRAILNIAMLLRDSEIAKEIRKQLLDVIEEDSTKENIVNNITQEQLLQLKVINAKTNDEAMLALRELNDFKNRHIKKLEDTIQIQAPKVDMYDTLIETKGLTDMKKVADGLNLIRLDNNSKLGRNKLFEYLRLSKVLIDDEYENNNGKNKKGDNHNIPYKTETNDKVFKIKLINEYTDSKGELHKKYKTYATGYGLSWIKKFLIKKEYCKIA